MLLYCIKQNLRWCYSKIFGFYVVAYNGEDVIRKRFIFSHKALNFATKALIDFSHSLADITVFNRKHKIVARFYKSRG